jgi:hypothetical protein
LLYTDDRSHVHCLSDGDHAPRTRSYRQHCEQLSGQVITRQEVRRVLSRLAQPPRRGCLDRFCRATTLLPLAGKRGPSTDCVPEVYNRYTSHGRDEAVALPSLCGHAPESPGQSSPESSVRKTSERCLTGEAYPQADLAAVPTSTAPISALNVDFRCTLVILHDWRVG